ncbi:MAG TPA: PBP1A family penicillin-binding protein [Candidatus Bathyarchaeia archaeon]|nr:PBP1A family penicillin-binding protein [Candidatus Bathyarchaeia archaeon]
MSWKRVWKKRLRQIKSRKYLNLSQLGSLKRAKILSYLAIFCFVSVLSGILIVGLLFAWYAKDLPHPDKIVRSEGFSTKIFDRQEKLLYDVFADQRRIPVKIEQVPTALRQATVAIEDKNFYKHHGFDPFGIVRALYNIVVHHRLQGGSTLTQQLVKNVLLTQKRVLSRKIKEFILAVQIENRYNKDQILQMYLNEAPYGGTAWGVEAAAEIYFGKKVDDLTTIECAILAGLPQRPSEYSPFGEDPKAYLGRTKVVLRRMREDGYLTNEGELQAYADLEKVQFAQEATKFRAPHFVMYVKKQLEDRYGQRMVEQGGLRVYTTLDLDLQEKAQSIVAEEIAKVKSLNIGNGAGTVIDPQTGEILAMIGSKDYFDPDYDGKVNVTLSLRQPGSAIKPLTYVTAFKKGYTAATLLMDTPTSFYIGSGQPGYKPVNYDGLYHGPLQVRYALGSSINITAVKMLARVGIKSMLDTAYDLGLSSLEPSAENLKRLGLSVTLGGAEVRLLELAGAYSSFANGGLRVEPIAILKVTDQEGKILEETHSRPLARVLSEGEAFLINHILMDNNARLLTFGTRSNLYMADRQVAVKTGTTNDKRDNWTIGWTPQVLVGIWVGNNDNSPMKEVASGVSGAAPIWRRIILEFLKDKPSLSFSVPNEIVTAEVDLISGYRAHEGYPSRLEYFIKGTEPAGPDSVHTKLKLCRGQDKLATEVDIARGNYEEKEYFVFVEIDPLSIDSHNRWQEGIDTWSENLQDLRYHPPREYCSTESEIEINFVKPADRIEVDSNEIEVKAEAISMNKITKIELYIDGSLRESFADKSFDRIYTLTDGTHYLKIEAEDEKGNRGSKDVRIGVKVPWDLAPSPTPEPTSVATVTPNPTITVMPTPMATPTVNIITIPTGS